MTEGRVQAPLIEAQSADIARAMASICNDEQGGLGVTGGHGRKTLSLSRVKNLDGVASHTRLSHAQRSHEAQLGAAA